MVKKLRLRSPKSGIVVPSLGNRMLFLKNCLESIALSPNTYVVFVAPADVAESIENCGELIDLVVKDPGVGLAEAINIGIRALPSSIQYCSWIGEDDLMEQGSIEHCEELLDTNSEAVMIFGGCKYINFEGRTIGVNKSGQWAVPLLRFGPCLIPQPGSLFRRKVFEQIGGLDSNFGWAFDFDMFIRFSKLGKLIHTKKTLASFRWHINSLSVGQRYKSVSEASLVRKRYLPKSLVKISILWESPVKFLTLHAGRFVSFRASNR